MFQVEQVLVLALALFATGVFGVLVRRDPVVLFISIEMMFNAVNLALVGLARHEGLVLGHALVLFVVAVAAAEVAVGLGIIIALFRARTDMDVDRIDELKG
jgi:NADH-quinone oxidoreductase subunit K